MLMESANQPIAPVCRYVGYRVRDNDHSRTDQVELESEGVRPQQEAHVCQPWRQLGREYDKLVWVEIGGIEVTLECESGTPHLEVRYKRDPSPRHLFSELSPEPATIKEPAWPLNRTAPMACEIKSALPVFFVYIW